MELNPQYTFDSSGQPVGVFLGIEDWENIVKQFHIEIPQWQKDLIDLRLEEYNRDPTKTIEWNDILKEFGIEDGENL